MGEGPRYDNHGVFWLINMSESFAELFEESFASKKIKPGSIITGTVVAINDDVVLVSAGLKSEAVIPIEQFKNDLRDGEIAVGDDVEVALDAVEDGFGETKLSREKAIRARTWIDLEKAFENAEVVEGVINGRVKGGFTVEIDNVRAFLPGSLVDVRPVRDPAYLEGKSLEFKVIKLDHPPKMPFVRHCWICNGASESLPGSWRMVGIWGPVFLSMPG